MFRNLEVQIDQLARPMNTGNQEELLRKTKINPRKHVKEIILRSNREFCETQMEKEKKRSNEKQ